MLRIWGRTTSSNVQKVLWTATEIGVEFERIDAGGSFGRTNEPAYRAMNPNGLVPTIEDGDFVLWESNTICRYLAAKHHATSLYPSELRQRADVERWQDWGSSVLAPAIFPAFFGLVRTAPGDRDNAAIRASAEKTAAALAIVEARLAGRDFLCGAALTLADMGIAINTYRWYNMDYASVGYQRPEMPALAAWCARLGARPAYREWVMVRLV
ncbi:MAG: glutathione S-transferase family protein [Burkholderiaceae bacterium]|nr:glutathione S-transferase family protein [Burkholderiaceae bacterium]